MADLLKNQYGFDVAQNIAASIVRVYPAFDEMAFLDGMSGAYDELELMARARCIRDALYICLPRHFEDAAAVLLRSLGPPLTQTERNGMAPFFYLPHVLYVAAYGLESFETAMELQYELTQRFTAEFSIRAFIERDPLRTLAYFERWVHDPNEHVRRLVSEGTRPRLPWAQRLRNFQKDPQPVLHLLEVLKDDESSYVRRSVANHLNDIAKDNPAIVLTLARAWLKSADKNRTQLVRHGLRTLIKQGHSQALALMGFQPHVSLTVVDSSIKPQVVRLGADVILTVCLYNNSDHPIDAHVDFQVHFVKANGHARPKVFKLKTLSVCARQQVFLSKKISLRPMTTRTHYSGRHAVDILLNGTVVPAGFFELSN